MRAFVLLGCFVVGTSAGAWLGYVAASVSGITSAEPPRFPGGHLAASALALGVLAGLSVLAQRVGGIGIGDSARAWAEGHSARNSLLLAAAFSAFAVNFTTFAFGQVSPFSLLPAFLVAVLLALGAIRRSSLLHLVGIVVGVLYALAGLAVSLAKAFWFGGA